MLEYPEDVCPHNLSEGLGENIAVLRRPTAVLGYCVSVRFCIVSVAGYVSMEERHMVGDWE